MTSGRNTTLIYRNLTSGMVKNSSEMTNQQGTGQTVFNKSQFSNNHKCHKEQIALHRILELEGTESIGREGKFSDSRSSFRNKENSPPLTTVYGRNNTVIKRINSIKKFYSLMLL